jgi:hypothetical protein
VALFASRFRYAQHQSDSKRAPGHLSHEGPELLRWALFEAAQQACRPASPDYEYYRQVRGGSTTTGLFVGRSQALPPHLPHPA